METFLEFMKEVLKGIVRAVSTFLFSKALLKQKKTTLRRHKVKGGSQKRNKI